MQQLNGYLTCPVTLKMWDAIKIPHLEEIENTWQGPNNHNTQLVILSVVSYVNDPIWLESVPTELPSMSFKPR